MVSGCSNPSLLGETTTTTIRVLNFPKRDIPDRKDVVKEEMVITDRSLVLTGKDLYINSKFIRSRIPASRFASITRGRDVNDTIDFPNEEMIDEVVQEVYNQATEEERQFFEENIEDIVVKFDIVIEVDNTDDQTKEHIKEMRENNQMEDELFNAFGVEEVALQQETTRAENRGELKLKKYRKLNKHNRYRKENEVIVKAYRLASLFLTQGEMEEFEKICKMFGVDSEKLEQKLEQLQQEKRKSRSCTGSDFLDDELANVWFVELKEKIKLKDGDIITRSLLGWAPWGGNYDHTGLFCEWRFTSNTRSDSKKNLNTEWAKCVLAAYPDPNRLVKWKNVPQDRYPERWEYASFEPLANFTDAQKIVVNRVPNEEKAKKAMNKAIDHFYGWTLNKEERLINLGNGTFLKVTMDVPRPIRPIKNDYDQWCHGWYNSYGYWKYYDHITETLKWSDASVLCHHSVNYCSYIAWYAYEYGAKINLDSDVDNSTVGYMKVPDDIVGSAETKRKKVWVRIGGTRVACPLGIFTLAGVYEEGYYIEKVIYQKTTDIVFQKSR